MKSILDPKFRYTSSVETDLRKTFARVRREQREAEAEEARLREEQRRRAFDKPEAAEPQLHSVTNIRKVK